MSWFQEKKTNLIIYIYIVNYYEYNISGSPPPPPPPQFDDEDEMMMAHEEDPYAATGPDMFAVSVPDNYIEKGEKITIPFG